MDVCWAADSSAFASAGQDRSCMVWDGRSGKSALRFEDHSHFVQGVAWHPASAFLVTQSSDRKCKCAVQVQRGCSKMLV